MPEDTKLSSAESDAKFLGWQKTLSGAIFPLYTITAENHPSYHSTVTDATLRSLKLRIPRSTVPYSETSPSPWQNSGIMLNHPKTAREAIEAAGLDYCVVRERLEANAGLKQESFAALRTDNGYILGVVHDGYESIQNRDAFKFCDYLVGAGEALYEAAGKFGHGEHIWILVKLSGFLEVPGSDRINKYLLLTNSHDGSAHVCAKVTPIRVVCNNTLTSALQGAGDIQISHTHDAVKNLEQAVKLLEWSNSLYKRLNGIFNAMASQKITEAQLQAYVQALVPDNEETETDERTENIRQSVLQLYESGRGANLSGGTLWGAFNSVTEYTDHLMLSGNATARLNSIWFGRGEQLKLKAFRLAMQMM